jgi:hypothetical protein
VARQDNYTCGAGGAECASCGLDRVCKATGCTACPGYGDSCTTSGAACCSGMSCQYSSFYQAYRCDY